MQATALCQHQREVESGSPVRLQRRILLGHCATYEATKQSRWTARQRFAGDAVTLERSRITGDKRSPYTAKSGTPVYWLPLPAFVLDALAAIPRISEKYFLLEGRMERAERHR